MTLAQDKENNYLDYSVVQTIAKSYAIFYNGVNVTEELLDDIIPEYVDRPKFLTRKDCDSIIKFCNEHNIRVD